MSRATFEIGREPTKPDPLRQIATEPLSDAERAAVDRVRDAIQLLVVKRNREDRERAMH